MIDLHKIKLGYSPLTETIYLFRHGKDINTALDKREAEKDVMVVLIDYMMHDSPKGSIKNVRLGDKYYEIIVRPIEK